MNMRFNSYICSILLLFFIISCSKAKIEIIDGNLSSVSASDASKICLGEVVAGITGTANCSEGGGPTPLGDYFLTFASRTDNGTFPVTPAEFAVFFTAPTREVATLIDEHEGNLIFSNNHSVIPSPLDDSDGYYSPCFIMPNWSCDYSDVPEYPEKRHHLETIAKNDPNITTRSDIVVCGSSGTIETRIADCKSKNGLWAFYDGKKYGQDGEGDWSLVTVVDNGSKIEVWRDDRTKLLWSDTTVNYYNWYQAAGYSTPSADSVRATQHTSEPGVLENAAPYNLNRILQPINPISVCPDVDLNGEIAAGGGFYTDYAPNPETDFKGGFKYPEVTWRLPSINDWKLADVNGIRKALPNMGTNYFWSSTTASGSRRNVWFFYGDSGYVDYAARTADILTRCVASVHE